MSADQQHAPRPGDNPHFAKQADAYVKAGFMRDLLPIIPFDADISAASRQPDALRKSRGKTPGLKRADGWVGFHRFTENVANVDQLLTWAPWDGGLGLLGRNTPAIDVDADVESVASAIESIARNVLGDAPVRSAGGARRLLTYRGQGHKKRCLSFTLPGIGKTQAVELLGDGQFYVVEGVHKSGQPYEWRNGVSPAHLGSKELTTVTASKLEEFFDRAADMLVRDFGATIVAHDFRSRTAERGHRVNSSAPTMQALRAVAEAIPDEYLVHYDHWIRFGLAIHAASEGSEDGYAIFEERSLRYGGDNTPTSIRAKWDSFKPTATGWVHLCNVAREYGFSAGRWEFDALEDDEVLGDSPRGVKAMFDRCVWVEKLQAVADLHTLEALNREQFNWRFADIGNPADSKGCAWAVFGAAVDRRRTVKSLTYRPGGPLFIYEEAERGECLNIWRGPSGGVPQVGTADDARPWLDHLTYLFGIRSGSLGGSAHRLRHNCDRRSA